MLSFWECRDEWSWLLLGEVTSMIGEIGRRVTTGKCKASRQWGPKEGTRNTALEVSEWVCAIRGYMECFSGERTAWAEQGPERSYSPWDNQGVNAGRGVIGSDTREVWGNCPMINRRITDPGPYQPWKRARWLVGRLVSFLEVSFNGANRIWTWHEKKHM